MNTRLMRRNRTNEDLGIKPSIDIMVLVDNAIKATYRINDAEYDFICKHATDRDTATLTLINPTFAEKREILIILNKYLNRYYAKLN